jgi:hypothetical protein
MWSAYRKLPFINAFRFDGDYTTEEVQNIIGELGEVTEERGSLIWYVKSEKLREEYIFIRTTEEIKSKSGFATVFKPISTLS